MKIIVMVLKLIIMLIYCLLYYYFFVYFICMFGILQCFIFNEIKVVWIKDEVKLFCINYMNELVGYKVCFGVLNVIFENVIVDCVVDIQVFVFYF